MTKYISINHISAKLIFLLIISALVPLITYGVISIYTARMAYFQSVSEGNKKVAIETAGQIELYMRNNLNILQGLANNLNRIYLTRWQKEIIIRNFVINFKEFKKIYIVDANGLEVATSSLEEKSLNRANQKPFKTAMQGKTYFSEVFISNNLVPSIIIALPMRGCNGLNGAIVGEIDLSDMWNLVDSINVGEKGFALVVSRSGLLIAHGDNERKADVFKQKNLSDLKIVESVLQGKSIITTYKNQAGLKVFGVGYPLKLLGWGVIIEQPVSEAFMVSNRMSWVLSILIAFFLAIMITIGTIGGKRLVRPIYEMIEATGSIASGDFSRKVKVSSRDEFEKLANSFNLMTDKLTELQDEIRVSERWSTFSRIAAGLVHDLKHPIKNIENSSKLIMRLYDDQEYREIFQKTVQREFSNINRFLDDLHNLTHPTPMAPIKLNIKANLIEIMNLYKEQTNRQGIELRLISHTHDLRILADKFLFERIIKNLMTNAIEAMPGGGLLSITLLKDDSSQGEELARISIEDTGEGMTPEKLDNIFTDHISTKRKGLGLGLALTKKNVLELGGSISVKSKVGHGTIFTLSFPLLECPRPCD